MPRLRIGAGRPELEDLGLDMEDRIRSRRPRPGDLAAGPDQPAGNAHSALDLEPHGDRRRVPAAGHQPLKNVCLRRLGVEMKRLGVELRRECLDLRFVERMRAGSESLANVQVVEVERLSPWGNSRPP